MFDRFNKEARKVMNVARQEAIARRHDFIGTEHILLGLLQQQTGVLPTVLASFRVDYSLLRKRIEESLPPTGPAEISMQLPFTPDAKRTLELSMEEANQLKHDYIGPEHLLIALSRINDSGVSRVLGDLKIKTDAIRNAVASAPMGK
jgi:ATP-dependent Clp protease ATP-binding subunit ClpC